MSLLACVPLICLCQLFTYHQLCYVDAVTEEVGNYALRVADRCRRIPGKSVDFNAYDFIV